MSKKDAILKAAAVLFASQGFDATTTRQISLEAGATEPLIYYHFKGKDDIFTTIVKSCFTTYYERLEELKKTKGPQFQKIEQLIFMHYRLLKEMPNEAYLIFSTCPSRLKDPSNYCTAAIQESRKLLLEYLIGCIKKGIKNKEFCKVPPEETAILITALISGLLRQRALGMEKLKTIRKAAIEFCRRSLVVKN